jgi:serine protease AprX
MLQANPNLTVDQIKQILQQTATPMLGYSQHEVGAGYLNTYAAVRKAGLGTPLGRFRDSFGDPSVSFSRDPIARTNGTVGPGSTYSKTFTVPADTLFATVEIGWLQNGSVLNFLTASLSGPATTIALPAPGLLGFPALNKTGVTLTDPDPGSWTINVTNDPAGAAQRLVIAVELFRAHYALTGLDQLCAADRPAATHALRTGLITAPSGDFAGSSSATRLDVARALMLGAGGRVPQYLPDAASFSDEPTDASAIFIESVTHSPFGDLMRTTGTTFNPQARVDRTSVAVALVKALGLDQEAQAASVSNPGFADWNLMPTATRGYISVAVSHNLMRAVSGYFRPSDSITRLDLAAAATALQQATR